MRAILVFSLLLFGCTESVIETGAELNPPIAPEHFVAEDAIDLGMPNFEEMAVTSISIRMSGYDGAATGQNRALTVADSDIVLCDFSNSEIPYYSSRIGLYADIVDIFEANINQFETIDVKNAEIDLGTTDFILWKPDEMTIKLLLPSDPSFGIFDPYEPQGAIAYEVVERVNQDNDPDEPAEAQCLVFG